MYFYIYNFYSINKLVYVNTLIKINSNILNYFKSKHVFVVFF